VCSSDLLAIAEAYSASALKGLYNDPAAMDRLQEAAPAVFLFVFLLFFGLALPIIVGVKSPIGLLIVGIALYEAWKINKRPRVQLTGPYAVAAPAPPPPGPSPQPSEEEGTSNG
jgi:hypothetical protein